MTQQINTPAFRGAPFDTSGFCLFHPQVQLSQKVVQPNGRIVYREVRNICPRCCTINNQGTYHRTNSDENSTSESIGSTPPFQRDHRMNSGGSFNKSARSNASSSRQKSDITSSYNNPREGGGVKSPNRGRRSTASSSGNNSEMQRNGRSSSRSRPRRSRSASRSGRGREEEETTLESSNTRSRSKSRDRRSSSVGRHGGGGSQQQQRFMNHKSRSRMEYDSPFDSKGRCHYHAQVQLAKKKLMGGWNVLLEICPKCMEESYINDDNRSVASGRSAKSCRSTKSSKSMTGTSRRVFAKNKSLYESPFDSNGYCHRHSHVRLAKKKTLGGWKIIQSFCTECAKEDIDDNGSVKSGKSRRSNYSRSSRVSKSSRRSSRRYEEEEETESAHSTSQSEQVKKRLVKKMMFRDDLGEEGLYTGYVNGEYQPHGRGKIVYANGDRYEGTWCEGSKVHGKSSRGKGGSNIANRSREDDRAFSRREDDGGRSNERSSGRRIKQNDSSSQDGSVNKSKPHYQLHSTKKQMDDYREMYTDVFPVILETKKVKGMRFVDYYGDPGRYTGEVNDANMPHGMGEMTYDHGLVQGGKWTNGVLDEGSIVSCPRSPRKTATDSSITGTSSRRINGVRDP